MPLQRQPPLLLLDCSWTLGQFTLVLSSFPRLGLKKCGSASALLDTFYNGLNLPALKESRSDLDGSKHSPRNPKQPSVNLPFELCIISGRRGNVQHAGSTAQEGTQQLPQVHATGCRHRYPAHYCTQHHGVQIRTVACCGDGIACICPGLGATPCSAC